MVSIPFSRVPLASFVLALMLAGYSISGILEGSIDRPIPQSTPGSDAATTPRLTGTPTPIADWPLFGTPEPQRPTESTPPASQAATVPRSKASYQLFGVISSHHETPRRAIIGTDPSNQQTIKEGERAPDGAIVRTIRDRDILLERNGMLESLALPEEYLQPTDAGGSPSLPPVGGASPAATEAEELKNYLRQQREAAIARGETPIYDAPK